MTHVRAGNLGVAAAVCLGVALLIQAIRPPRENPAVDPSKAMAAYAPMPAPVDAIVHRACYDCHSNQTTWPWYSGVAPVSWFVISHVNGGRLVLNFDDADVHRPSQPGPPLGRICAEVTSGGMPLSSYLWMHANATLAADDKAALCTWANGAAEAHHLPIRAAR